MESLLQFFIALHPTIQLLLILAVTYLIKGGYIVTKWTKAKKKGPGNIHAPCKNYPDYIMKKKEERYKGGKIFRLKYYDCTSEQMAEIDIVLDIMQDKYIENFKEYLQTYNPKEESKINAIKVYRLLLKGGFKEATGLLRRCMKKNHLADRSDLDYQSYMQERISAVYKKINDYTEDNYIKSTLIVPYEKIHIGVVIDVAPVMAPLLLDMFIKARKISEDTAAEIKRIEKEN